ncbi:VCBS repeat-containing protein [Polaribacter sp. IC063]|uniref:VCBS repeat-containing protein n=1 Tax=Polaribacter sp. IC063 TaxID=57031 RepID=UPI0011BE89AF|nr:VCBS repeat-containing protein [Polaribacter sp. IC063]TXD51939.1 hypothetical protein ES043_09985 [Polaribacter sp. IC063]
MFKPNLYIVFLALLNFLLFSCNNSKRDINPKELLGGLQLLASDETGIDFNNSIKESEYLNHYFFGQIYVGSGVAIGDLDNDGLPDVFFGGNQVGDRLYLNKGNFKFDDISKSSKIARSPGWSWGVTMADVNADGYLDIYVSRNGNSLELTKRRNMLFINNKDLTFTESAIAYGLADTGFSSQAVFFDMDNDGDLDMYQVNQPADNKVLLVNKVSPKDYESFKDKIYRNTNNKFEDVSEEVGISRDLGYGLSVNASDFNNDGFIDLYVSNDYAAPDFMYYNNGDGTFRNVTKEKLKHFSQYSMGSDTGDINNDGFIDLVTTDMTPNDHYRSKMNMASMNSDTFQEMVKATDSYQYMTNTLQINTGLGMFSDIANIAGVANTDWSWASLLVDIDNDGFKDLLVTNGIKKDIDNNDYKKEVSENSKDITYKELFKYSQNTPSNPVGNYAFKNNGDFKFTNVSKKWNFNTPSFSNGMAYADLDNDGDLDIVVNNIDGKAFVYKNKATANFLKIKLIGSEKNKFGIGAKVKIYHNKKQQILENTTTRGYFSSVENGLLFGLANDKKVDKIEVLWNNKKVSYLENIDVNQTLEIQYSEAVNKKEESTFSKQLFTKANPENFGLDYKHRENEFDEFKEEVLLPHKLSNNGPFSAVADVNKDGFEDLFIGGSADQEGVLYLQNNQGNFTKSNTQPWVKDKESEDLGALFVDVDNDNDLDLYVTSGGSEFKQGSKLLKDRLYINDGLGNFIKDSKAIPDILESTQTVKSSDIDNDGDLDLFIGVRLISGKYAFPASSYLLINENGVFKKSANSIAPDLENLGMVTDAVFSDIDKDGDHDLLLVGEWMHIKVFENQNGIFKDSSVEFGISKDSRGFWWSITAEDLDNDGDDDYIIGNLGENNKFKTTKEHPFKVYANDFDNNGTNDVVLAKFYKDNYVPVRGKECTSQQMPYVSEKFKSYHSFASSTLLEILPEEKVKSAVIYEISNFESIILINNKGKLASSPLPIQAQISPIKSSIVKDVNSDGFKDIILVGNHYGVEVETVRYDAGFGAVLIGDGKNNFKYISPSESGFYIPKDTRNIKGIKIRNKESLIITNNNDSLFLFTKN